MSVFSNVDGSELFEMLTVGPECEVNTALITVSILNSNLTLQEAVNERLDILFDEIFSSNLYLSKNRDLLEKTLRRAGSSWKERLEKS